MAIVSGKNVETLALESIRASFQETLALPSAPYDQWLRDFDAWVGSHRSRNPNLDDSRDSIYSGRE